VNVLRIPNQRGLAGLLTKVVAMSTRMVMCKGTKVAE
jgi:hypothetical protein